MVIFHSYVSLPEGNLSDFQSTKYQCPSMITIHEFSIEHWIGSRENLQEPPLFHVIYLYMYYILFIVVYGKIYKKTLDLMVKTMVSG